jgi:arsenate reductase (thioredoxin)
VIPGILFACIHNSGRSVAAEALARSYAGDAVQIRPARTPPSAG